MPPRLKLDRLYFEPKAEVDSLGGSALTDAILLEVELASVGLPLWFWRRNLQDDSRAAHPSNRVRLASGLLLLPFVHDRSARSPAARKCRTPLGALFDLPADGEFPSHMFRPEPGFEAGVWNVMLGERRRGIDEMEGGTMSGVKYEIVQHDGGWAYKVGGTFSETFDTRDDARSAARRAAAEQRLPGDTEIIEFEDEQGHWRHEVAAGEDRPEILVEDTSEVR